MQVTIFRGKDCNYQPTSIDYNANMLYWSSPGIITTSLINNIKITFKNKAYYGIAKQLSTTSTLQLICSTLLC